MPEPATNAMTDLQAFVARHKDCEPFWIQVDGSGFLCGFCDEEWQFDGSGRGNRRAEA